MSAPSPLPPLDDDGSLYVFAYGSLIWRPGFAYSAMHPALLRGFHRRFCIWSRRYRGTPEAPGLVLGLDRGGSCRGVAFQVPGEEAAAVLDYLVGDDALIVGLAQDLRVRPEDVVEARRTLSPDVS